MGFIFANNVASRLAAAVNTVQTTLTLTSGTGERFPSPDSEAYEQFAVTLHDPDTGVREICYCTSRDGDVLTVDRAQESTIAYPFPAGSEVSMQLTAGILEYLRDL